jgi:hypothetical protein
VIVPGLGANGLIPRAAAAEVASTPSGARPSPKINIGAEHAALHAAYAEKLAELAAWADGRQLTAEAQLTRDWLPAVEPNRLALACRPTPDDATLEPFASTSAAWRERFGKLRTAQGAALFDLAVKAAGHGHAAEAFPLLVEVIREQPDHEKARRILGYEKYEGRWLTPFEVAKARDGQVWHAKFGWLPAAHVARYEGGERYYNNRWITVDEEQRLRGSSRKGWDIITEHYNIHTTHSLEAGVQLARRLERLYDAWQQLFASFYATDEQLARRFNLQAATRSTPQRHRVMYFRDRDEYLQALERKEQNIGVSTGYYLAAKKTAYFYAEEKADLENLNHEATHQLFTEIRPSARDMGRDGNFWVVEGIACLMESLTEAHGWHLVGGNDAERLVAAQHRLLVNDFYVPLAQLTTMSMDQLKVDPNIATLYSQATGLTYFLMFADDGRYRAALVAYLSAIYRGQDRAGTLTELCRSNYEELDAQYRDYLKSIE